MGRVGQPDKASSVCRLKQPIKVVARFPASGLKRNYFCGLNPELLASMSMFNGYFNCHLSGMISTCAAVFHPVQGPDFHVIGMTVWLLAQSSNKTLKLYTNRDK